MVSQSRFGLGQGRIESHQPLGGRPGGYRPSVAAVGLPDGVVERSVMDVVQARAVVDAVRGDSMPTSDELLEKRVAFLAAVGDAGEGGILAFDAQTRVPHHEHEEPGLALGEAVVGEGLHAFVGRHRQNSSARPPWRPPPPRRPPLRPPIRRLGSAIAREPRPGHAGGVRTAVMLRRDLDVVVVPSTIRLLVLNPEIREMDFVIEVRQVVFACPTLDFLCRPVGVSVVVVAVPIALMQPALVLTLELMVEHDSFELRAALCQALRSAFVGPIDLDVVFELPFAFNAVPEGLAVTLIAVAMVFEQASAVFRQRHRMLARARHSNRLDQSLFAQMSQVA